MLTELNILHNRLERLEQDNAAAKADNTQLNARLQQTEVRYRHTQRRLRVQLGLAMIAVISVIFVSPSHRAAHAQGYGITLQTLQNQINTLSTKFTTLDTAFITLSNTVAQDTASINDQHNKLSTLNTTVTTLSATVAGHTDSINALNTTVAGQTTSITALNTTVAGQTTSIGALQTKTQYQSVSGTSTIFSGTNVYVQSGSGSTDGPVNGLGNFIVGYNHMGHVDFGTGSPLFQDIRTGSHNLIVGDKQNYTSYGGIVAGYNSTISGGYAAVTGGESNTASHYFTSVCGGQDNTASFFYAAVSGGSQNTASGVATSVSGGANVTQHNDFAWSGGSYHTP